MLINFLPCNGFTVTIKLGLRHPRDASVGLYCDINNNITNYRFFSVFSIYKIKLKTKIVTQMNDEIKLPMTLTLESDPTCQVVFYVVGGVDCYSYIEKLPGKLLDMSTLHEYKTRDQIEKIYREFEAKGYRKPNH